ncbi:hypothetical protein D9756_009892 [Leucocoprinus leucothites]|uniref:Uncharacterized protein n=1 Tax=Leucocoprinus leucothites TaxID=201217 RepID=A0A8H5CSN0_9AGAR|nr:hypothetical protein D9756_009892 [Leucoagaricus leucothites]
MDNCGSVTPGVLRSITPLIQQNIRAVSLGLSYSLADEDVFVFLRDLSELERVELRYYWQLKSPKSRPNLARLKSFTACHANFQTREEVQSLCKWIRRAISVSPIQALQIVQDERDDDDDDGVPSNTGANISFRSVVDHLCARHSKTLCVLNMENAYIDIKSLKKLFATCMMLEEVHLCVRSYALTLVKKYSGALTKLHTASFNTKNIRLGKRRVIDMELVATLLKHGPPHLRTLSVNGQTWESAWKRTRDDSFSLAIHKQPRLVFPWDRKQKLLALHEPETPLPQESVLRPTPVVAPVSDNVERAVRTTSAARSGTDVKGSRLCVRFSEPS